MAGESVVFDEFLEASAGSLARLKPIMTSRPSLPYRSCTALRLGASCRPVIGIQKWIRTNLPRRSPRPNTCPSSALDEKWWRLGLPTSGGFGRTRRVRAAR